jgi:hypothetical protein
VTLAGAGGVTLGAGGVTPAGAEGVTSPSAEGVRPAGAEGVGSARCIVPVRLPFRGQYGPTGTTVAWSYPVTPLAAFALGSGFDSWDATNAPNRGQPAQPCPWTPRLPHGRLAPAGRCSWLQVHAPVPQAAWPAPGTHWAGQDAPDAVDGHQLAGAVDAARRSRDDMWPAGQGLARWTLLIHRRGRVLGGVAVRAACGGHPSLPWLPRRVVRRPTRSRVSSPAMVTDAAGGGHAPACRVRLFWRIDHLATVVVAWFRRGGRGEGVFSSPLACQLARASAGRVHRDL